MTEKLLKVSISIPDEARFEEILAKAVASGFRKDVAMPMLGVATGTVAASALYELRRLEGIGEVEEQRTLFSAR